MIFDLVLPRLDSPGILSLDFFHKGLAAIVKNSRFSNMTMYIDVIDGL